MPKDGDLLELKESQTIALQLQKEKIDNAMKGFNAQMEWLKKGLSNLLILIGKELKIPEEEASNWHLNQKVDAFVYKAPDSKDK